MASTTGFYSGRWRRSLTDTPPNPPDVQARNPEHLNPTANPEPGPQPWQSTVAGPALPAEIVTGGLAELPYAGGLGPVFEPGPALAAQPPLGLLEAQAVRGAAHLVDDGGPAKVGWTHPQGFDDVRHLDDYHLGDAGSASPQTLRLAATGVESPEDPGARRSRRIQRWIDRRIEMHRYEPAFQGKRPKNAVAAFPQFAPNVPTQRDSHGGTIVVPASALATSVPDRFVEPLQRTAPTDWQQSMPAVDAGSGLTIWGA